MIETTCYCLLLQVLVGLWFFGPPKGLCGISGKCCTYETIVREERDVRRGRLA